MGTQTENYFDADEILNQFGDINTLALENIIDPNDGTDDEMTLMKPSQYYTIDNLPVNMSNFSNFNVISLKAQSINAKFDSLLTFLEVARQQNIMLHVLCIQETWLEEKSDLSLYQIEGYTCISQGKRCSSHGCGKYIYRPPYDNNKEKNVTLFVTEMEPIIATLNDNNHELLIAGDFNINLLHINTCNKEHFGQFLDMPLSYSLFPKITFPTRLGENSCSLINNIFCSLSHKSVASLAGIMCTRISEHFPCFVSLRLRNDGASG